MRQQRLGHSDLWISRLGLGTVKLGRDQGVRYPTGFRIPDNRAAGHLLDVASELGINLLDTAPAYGSSEERLGALLAGRRNRFVLSTKVGESFEDGASSWNFSPEAVTDSVRRSLTRLRTDHLDIVLIHSDGRDREIIERMGTLQALVQLKQQGLIRAVGISHKSADGAACAIDAGCDVIMATLHPDYVEELPQIARAAAAGCGVLVKKALASGHAAPASLAFAAAQPGVTAVVIGTINPAHLTANARLIESLE